MKQSAVEPAFPRRVVAIVRKGTLTSFSANFRCGSRIWSRGAPGSETECCRHSKVELRKRSKQITAGVQGPLKEAFGSFWVFNAEICILPNSRDYFSLIFWHLFQHQKLIKIEHYIVFQSFWDILIYFTYYLNPHEKVMLWLNDLRRYAKRSETRKFYDMGGEK